MDQKYDDFKRRVKESSDIVEVISSYISLQKRGRYYWACCPFHGEKTPSFSVDKERQFFLLLRVPYRRRCIQFCRKN